MRRAVALAIALIGLLSLRSPAEAWSPFCSLGATRCISTQGTLIPVKQVLEMLTACEDLTRDNAGRIAMRMTQAEVIQREGRRIGRLSRAWYAYEELDASPLQYDRRTPMETRYHAVARACQRLESDFEKKSLWTR